MDNSSKMIPAYGRIWLVASLINAILTTLLLMIGSWAGVPAIFGSIVLIFIFSMLFAKPGIIVSLALTAFVLFCKTRLSLFGIVLTVSFCTSLLTAIYFMNFLGAMDKDSLFLCSSIVISALMSVFFCRDHLLENITAEE